mmetsp:Transcript_26347/g.81036  ORF Transcript_26347/g.81036 Transcript_26347/m.81036 type:complete len:219 (-) Transcript_26347:1444-2100(-)
MRSACLLRRESAMRRLALWTLSLDFLGRTSWKRLRWKQRSFSTTTASTSSEEDRFLTWTARALVSKRTATSSTVSVSSRPLKDRYTLTVASWAPSHAKDARSSRGRPRQSRNRSSTSSSRSVVAVIFSGAGAVMPSEEEMLPWTTFLQEVVFWRRHWASASSRQRACQRLMGSFSDDASEKRSARGLPRSRRGRSNSSAFRMCWACSRRSSRLWNNES